MPDDLRWSWYNNNRNKVHNKFNMLESSWNHFPTTGPLKNCLLRNRPLVQKGRGPLLYCKVFLSCFPSSNNCVEIRLNFLSGAFLHIIPNLASESLIIIFTPILSTVSFTMSLSITSFYILDFYFLEFNFHLAGEYSWELQRVHR